MWIDNIFINVMEKNSKLYQLRKSLGMTQKEFAKTIGIDPANFNSVENCNRAFSPSMKWKICDKFGLPLDYFNNNEINIENSSINLENILSLTPEGLIAFNKFLEELKRCYIVANNKTVSEYYGLLTDKGRLTVDNIIKIIYEQEKTEMTTNNDNNYKSISDNKNK